MNSPEAQNSSHSEGFLRGIGESLRTHFDERLRSPFGGAFIVAWLAVNWEPLLILMFGSASIEDRINVVKQTHLSAYSVIVNPLWLAVLIALAFYVLSTIFIAIYGLYETAKNWIERWFERRIWVPPSVFLAHKQRTNEHIGYLEGLATDKLEAIQEHQNRTAQANEKLIQLQGELSEVTSKLTERNAEYATLLEENREVTSSVTLSQAEIAAFLNDRRKLKIKALEIADLIYQLRKPLQDAKLQTDPSAWNSFLRLGASVDDVISALADGGEDEPISAASLSRFLQGRIPDLPVNPTLLNRVLGDIQSSRIPELQTIADIDKAVTSAWSAVVEYSKARPDLFKSSVDYLSKSLGIMFPKFRSTHRFSAETKEAFSKYEYLVKK